jgi:prepilin-type N-terminal cleavage/methylation domain-containing protein
VNRRGLTIPEVLVAIVILTVGLLGLAASGLHVTALVAQGGRTGAATSFALRRLELLRATACRSALPPDGTAELRRGSTMLATTTWTSRVVADGHVGIRVVTRYTVAARRARSDTLETVVVCR